VVTLLLLARVEKRIKGPCEMRALELKICADRPLELARVEAVLHSAEGPTRVEEVRKDETGTSIRLSYCIRHPSHRAILWEIGELGPEEI
jgi:hypothetical protein